jgi:transcriptional antiterminator RfaH
MLKWKVLHVKYGHEIKVEQQLGRFGIVNYLPKIKIIRQWSDRKKVIITPAFPGYIFINSDNTLRNKVFYAKGVLKYVRSDNKDATLENDEIEMIRIAESSISASSAKVKACKPWLSNFSICNLSSEVSEAG